MVSADSKPSSSVTSQSVNDATINTAADSDADVRPPPSASDSPHIEKQQDEGAKYITGYKLAIVVACVALSCFLMLLDTMIISTVS
jgi:hypothetical protein